MCKNCVFSLAYRVGALRKTVVRPLERCKAEHDKSRQINNTAILQLGSFRVFQNNIVLTSVYTH